MAHHDPTTVPDPASITGDELRHEYGDRWVISFDPDMRAWSAEQRSPDGRQRRYITQHSPAELADRLAAAETAGQ